MQENEQLVITPLGGLGEIGLNCQLWKTSRGVVMVDCGLMFPSDEHLGVDVVIPHFGAVAGAKQEMLGIVLTHGHEDHIGALPWIVPELRGVDIYGSPLTLALVEHKLREHDIFDLVHLHPVLPNETRTIGDLTFHFFPVCHSIPQGYALGVETPVGRILHTGDFKLDSQPLSGTGTDLSMLGAFAGEEGLRLLMSDSTNIERPGRSLTEREVKASLDSIFARAEGRVVITLFSSHLQRIQEVFDLAEKYGRTVVISGRSLANNIEMAQKLGILHTPQALYNAYAGVPDLPDSEVVLVVTGAQGEPMSALSRMAFGGHRQLSIHPGDTVVMSSRVIPGNARVVTHLIDEMYRQGAEVLYESVLAIHASGHAQRDELKEMLLAVRPEFFVPVHGEYRHLIKHGRLAAECGVAKDKVVILEDGHPLKLTSGGVELLDPIPVDYTLVDGKGVGDVGGSVLRERRILGEEGMVVVSLVMDIETDYILGGPELLSRGFVYDKFEYVFDDAKCLVLDEVEKSRAGLTSSPLQDNIRGALRQFFRRVLDRDPIVVVVISRV
ncbi:MAG: ribonuclease J [Desulfovibrionaceae bacterium]|nr:ribonuclease J [Desulfovibrionaceae bacterium]